MNAPLSLIGIVPGLSNEDYHAGPGVSCSGLHLIAKSPEIFYGRTLDPLRPPREEKPGQLEGTLAHCAVLEPGEFHQRYAVGPAASKATKEWKAFAEANADRVCIKPDQYETAMRQAESVRRLPQVVEALSHGFPEMSAYWIHPETGELCRCRPDWVSPAGDGAILLDLKTCSDASPAEFRRQIARKRYHVQDAFYSDGYAAASGAPVLGFVFVAVETEWPFAACAVMIDEQSQEAGREAYQQDLTTYHKCKQSGIWPGYSASIEQVTLPAWAFRRNEE